MGSSQLGTEKGVGSLLMVDGVAKEASVMKSTERLLESEALVIALALSLGLDTVIARWLAFIAFYTSPSACFKKRLSDDLVGSPLRGV